MNPPRRSPRRRLAILVISLFLAAPAAPVGAQAPVGKPTRPAVSAAAAPLADFDAAVAKMMANWKVPGAAIAIVKDGKVILSKGYGLRDVKNNLPVTAQTMFPIASITKSFTVATLASLVSDGKLAWDKPVRDYLPEFRLNDDVLTARVTTRDLVTHRTGRPGASIRISRT